MTISQANSALALLSTLSFCPPVTKAEDATSKVATIAVPGGGKPFVARTDNGGEIHLLFDSADGPKYAKSTDNDVTFDLAVAVVPGRPRQAGLDYSAWDLAVGKGGRVHVAMSTNAWKLKLPEEEWRAE
jgi:hypothetical protein